MGTIFGVLVVIIIVLVLVRSANNQNAGQAKEKPRRSGVGNYGKWIGGGLGWTFGGPIGAIIGFALGSMFGNGNKGYSQYMGQTAPRQDFSASLIVMSAAVMKADGVVKKSELDYVKAFFLRNFGQDLTEKYILTLREVLKQDINIAEVSQQIGQYMEYSSRLQLLHYLFGIASADGQVHNTEVDVISSMARYMSISDSDFQSIKAMFVQEVDNSYTILGITPDATDDEVKKAYREMAKKYHPDKVGYLGEDVRKSAEQKFKEVNDAYEKIKKQRGMK